MIQPKVKFNFVGLLNGFSCIKGKLKWKKIPKFASGESRILCAPSDTDIRFTLNNVLLLLGRWVSSLLAKLYIQLCGLQLYHCLWSC